MIEFTTRKEIFKQHKNITAEISLIQNAMFEEDDDLFENEQDKIEYSEMFDCRDAATNTSKKFYKVISFNHAEIESFSEILAKKLTALLTEVGISKLIVIAHLKMNFFGANLKHNYKPVKNEYKKLEQITHNKNYNEAFVIDSADLTEFIDIAFWLERCDASAPEYIFFYDKENRLALNVCKDGNVHTVEFEHEILSSSIINKQEWYEIEGRCFDKFTQDGKITGRITKVK